MSELTVSMPAYNAGRHIQQSIDSVLGQQGVDLELVVVDDGSTDQTVDVVASCRDARVRLLRNSRRMGAGYCHNRVLRESRSRFVAHMDAEAFLMPGALRKMMDALENDSRSSRAHCYSFDVDADGRITREAFQERWRSLRDNGLTRDGRTGLSVDYHVALRVPERDTVKLVPEFLYGRRRRQNKPRASSGRVKGVRARERLIQPAGNFLRWKVLVPVATALYRSAARYLSWWPLGVLPNRASRAAPAARRIAYYHHAFPMLNQTFIQREILALRQSGVTVDVIAHAARDAEYLDDDGKQFMETTHYVNPMRRRLLAGYKRAFSRRRPLRYLNLFLYTMLRPHSARKSFQGDLELFNRAVCVAGVLEERGITHIHSPWAGPDAFVALLASRLHGIPYTVQARASDLHRTTSVYGLRETLDHAAFAVTNARFNEPVIRSLLPPASAGKLRTIYEGLDLERFQPGNGRRQRNGVVRILSVARLTEPKGLEHLIRACGIIKNAGHIVRCDIVGGRVPAEVNYFLRLLRLRRSLALEQEVTFLHAQPFARVMTKYEEADLFVLPSQIVEDGRGDVTPNSVIEAMAMKLPVVSTWTRGIPEIVQDGVSGLLVPPGDPDALAQAMMRLIQNKELRAELGDNGRRIVEQRFDIRKNIKEVVALFQDGGDRDE